MTRQPKISRQRVEKERERRKHETADELPYLLESRAYVEAKGRSFIEAYRHGQLRLELHCLTVNHELDRQYSEHAPVAYDFSGLIGPEDATVLHDKSPLKSGIHNCDGQHVVLVAIGELTQVQEGMLSQSLGLHLVGLKPANCDYCS